MCNYGLCKLTGSPVSETVVDTVSGKFARTGSNKYMVTLKAGINDLDNDLLVGEADDEAIFRGVAAVSVSLDHLQRRIPHTTCSSPEKLNACGHNLIEEIEQLLQRTGNIFRKAYNRSFPLSGDGT
jgi:hypothetical protein